MKTNNLLLAISVAAVLAVVVAPALTSNEAFADRKTAPTGCTNKSGNDIDDKTTCPSSSEEAGQLQQTCHSNAHGKCVGQDRGDN